MGRPHVPTPEFPRHLDRLYDRFPVDRSLADDPLSCVRPLATDARAAEVAGLFAATLAVGNTAQIRRSFGELVRRAGGDLPGFVGSVTPIDWASRLAGYRHRWIRGDQLGYLALTLKAVYARSGSLEALFVEGLRSGGFAGGLDELARALRAGPGGPGAPRPPRGYAALFPSPLETPRSACKRLTLFVRWMVRPGFPDLGVWRRVPTRELRIPLDQHVHWIAYHLGLTHRRTRGWAAVEEVTEALRRVDPEDPVKYDFVLCHTGISGDCPKRRDAVACAPCSVRPDCLMWRGARGAA